MARASGNYEILEFKASNGKFPFREWLESQTQGVNAIVAARLARVQAGILGTYRSLGHGIYELKLDFGPGYRIYFGIEGKRFIVLLAGGEKKSQKRDIKKAKSYWQSYAQRR